ncbi:MAG: EF2563 family selenium-dependent molybdenum hydroxylase system protein [Mogibacterium sp.]|nr:EF2563 family selenium-dependent molybdenum hydroxylase system protein [Mogibacterium sp.]
MLVVIKGAGDLASGIALRLHRAHIKVVMTDLPVPLAVRRTVAFSEAIRLGSTYVEEARAERVENKEEIMDCLERDVVPVMVDPEAKIVGILKPDIVVDAILAKRNLGTTKDDAPFVIAVGPGFTAGEDCHVVVETKRGHTLGRVIREGSAIANTGVPGNIGGQTINRLIKAPVDGIFHPEKNIGDIVEEGERVGNVDGVPVCVLTGGMIRGLLQDGVRVTKGLKSGDVDPRGDTVDFMTVSDKASAIGGGVLEAIVGFAGGI